MADGAPLRFIFMGTGEIGLPSLHHLLEASGGKVVAVVTQPDKPAGRKQELRASPIKELARQRGLPVLQPVKLRAPESVAEIVQLRPDVIVVMAYGQILPKSVLEDFALGSFATAGRSKNEICPIFHTILGLGSH